MRRTEEAGTAPISVIGDWEDGKQRKRRGTGLAGGIRWISFLFLRRCWHGYVWGQPEGSQLFSWRKPGKSGVSMITSSEPPAGRRSLSTLRSSWVRSIRATMQPPSFLSQHPATCPLVALWDPGGQWLPRAHIKLVPALGQALGGW